MNQLQNKLSLTAQSSVKGEKGYEADRGHRRRPYSQTWSCSRSLELALKVKRRDADERAHVMAPTAQLTRTALHAWQPAHSNDPLLLTATVSGALDPSFSTDSLLELWTPFSDSHTPRATARSNARFNTVQWGTGRGIHGLDADNGLGVVAAGMEDGQVGLWDPARMLDAQNGQE